MDDPTGNPPTPAAEAPGRTRLLNVAGTMTALGASIMRPEAIAAMAAIAPLFVDMDDLQRTGSAVIARATGAEAGFVTASASAGVALLIAAAITGESLTAVEALPDRPPAGRPTGVVLQAGHAINYGAPVEQLVRLAGGRVVVVGAATETRADQVADALAAGHVAAVLHVVSHHTSRLGMLPLDEIVRLCAPYRVPVFVDAASEYDLRGFLAAGADAVVYSGHKFLGGPTSGIVAGRRELVRAAYLQNRGIGRPMKAGKESVAGVLAALQAWSQRDHDAARRAERAALDLWASALAGLAGISTRIEPDPTGNPIERLRVDLTPQSGFTAAGLAATLARGAPSIRVREEGLGSGYLELDPCNLHPGDAETVADRLSAVLRAPNRPPGAMARPATAAGLPPDWPDPIS